MPTPFKPFPLSVTSPDTENEFGVGVGVIVGVAVRVGVAVGVAVAVEVAVGVGVGSCVNVASTTMSVIGIVK